MSNQAKHAALVMLYPSWPVRDLARTALDPRRREGRFVFEALNECAAQRYDEDMRFLCQESGVALG